MCIYLFSLFKDLLVEILTDLAGICMDILKKFVNFLGYIEMETININHSNP